ncbi:hypothetical protein [Streptomyces stelliscabiei]|uniref:hypothetical protein n=1 Tax=Streptomyces stelliscabiei TaxID=146820 RepID=UPI0029AD3BF0|nr:hypothetical protein [Streptomyces stelliscabiei]MDX2557653.1 hypothetical protein [Streptomyces stelliscabiei]MDX2617094.1 hypothetical protein [Streptomyces stelliscabiei]MDX2641468.1 hypothetical protein [Streptomyces stelliscabiei]MDX2666482.1 hypothetical protein [Streptomyces stelliscabiei]MDX2717321.1 hypothetical protein [Streptomyces stelliscabiei]
MCRPEKPISTSNNALRELQEWLREQKKRIGQGYRALSVRAGCHATTLQRAAGGETVAPLRTVLKYARACDASREEAKRLWKEARYEETCRARGAETRLLPRPESLRGSDDLREALQVLHEKAGSPALRTMEVRAGEYGILPRSTAHRIVTKEAVPHSLPQLRAYLRACDLAEELWPRWESAWTRIRRYENQENTESSAALIASRTKDLVRAHYEVVPLPVTEIDISKLLDLASRRKLSRRERRGEARRTAALLEQVGSHLARQIFTIHDLQCRHEPCKPYVIRLKSG